MNSSPSRPGPWRLTLAALLAVGLSGPAQPVQAQRADIQSLTNTVRQLQRQLQALERSVGRSTDGTRGSPLALDNAAPNTAAQLLLRVNDLERELRIVTGRIEETENDIAILSRRLERTLVDFDFRLRVLEGGGQAPVATAPAIGDGDLPRTLGPSVPKPSDLSSGAGVRLPASGPDSQYSSAYDLVLQGRYAQAQTAFEAFISANPDHERAGNSQYWLGETFFARGQFDSAARAFARGFERYPDSEKVTHNLLKLGMSLAQLDRADNACDTFDLLLDDFPAAPTSVLQRAVRERELLTC